MEGCAVEGREQGRRRSARSSWHGIPGMNTGRIGMGGWRAGVVMVTIVGRDEGSLPLAVAGTLEARRYRGGRGWVMTNTATRFSLITKYPAR
jgi:hypothetical protein